MCFNTPSTCTGWELDYFWSEVIDSRAWQMKWSFPQIFRGNITAVFSVFFSKQLIFFNLLYLPFRDCVPCIFLCHDVPRIRRKYVSVSKILHFLDAFCFICLLCQLFFIKTQVSTFRVKIWPTPMISFIDGHK